MRMTNAVPTAECEIFTNLLIPIQVRFVWRAVRGCGLEYWWHKSSFSQEIQHLRDRHGRNAI